MNYSIEPTWAQLDEQNRTHYASKARPAILDDLDNARLQAWEWFEQYADNASRPGFSYERYTELLKVATDAEERYHAEYRRIWGMA